MATQSAGEAGREAVGLTRKLGVITSWTSAECTRGEDQAWRHPAIVGLSERGITCFEYYFLSPSEFPVIQDIIGREAFDKCKSSADLATALCRLPDRVPLAREDGRRLQELAKALHLEYGSGLLGTPHFRSVATNIPGLASANAETRAKAVRALMVAVQFASIIGASSVELVCGVAAVRRGNGVQFARPDGTPEGDPVLKGALGHLVDSLRHVAKLAAGLGVSLALEIEPGPCFINNSPSRCVDIVRRVVQGDRKLRPHVGINVDVGHMLLLAGQEGRAAEEARSIASQVSASQYVGLAKEFASQVISFHLSDHACSHHSDLTPGSYHGVEQFRPWLKLYDDLCKAKVSWSVPDRLTVHPSFCGVISIELESAEDADAVGAAWTTFGAWLFPVDDRRKGEGAILLIDIVSSTPRLFADRAIQEEAVGALEEIISDMIDIVEGSGGRVVNFTGDGVLAVFDESQHPAAMKKHISADVQANVAMNALHGFFQIAQRTEELASRRFGELLERQAGGSSTQKATRHRGCFRAAVHWGDFYLTSLRFSRDVQVAGREIVATRRLIDWLHAHTRQQKHAGTQTLLSSRFVEKLSKSQQDALADFRHEGSIPISGIDGYEMQAYVLAAEEFTAAPRKGRKKGTLVYAEKQ